MRGARIGSRAVRLLRERWASAQPVCVDLLNRTFERARRRVFGDERRRAVLHGDGLDIRVVEGGDDDDVGVGRGLFDLAADFQPVEVGHHQIHDEHVRPQRSDRFDSRSAIRHAGNNFAGRSQQSAERDEDGRMIVGQHDSRSTILVSRHACAARFVICSGRRATDDRGQAGYAFNYTPWPRAPIQLCRRSARIVRKWRRFPYHPERR
jgi:hypothetical protein